MASDSSDSSSIAPKGSRCKRNALHVRPKTVHEIQLDCCKNVDARSAHWRPNQGVTSRSLHYTLSEGSMPKGSLFGNDSATLPLSLLSELSEVLNQLGQSTLNKLALLLGLTQEQFNKLYHSTRNPAGAILTQSGRFVKTLDQFQQAFEDMGLHVAASTIAKHQHKTHNNESCDIFKTIGLPECSAGLKSPCDRSWEKLDHGIFSMHTNDEGLELPTGTLSDKSLAASHGQFKSTTYIGSSSCLSSLSPSDSMHMETDVVTETFKEDQNISENRTLQDQDLKGSENKSLDLEAIDSGFGSAEVFPAFGSLSNRSDSVLKLCHSASGYFDEEGGMLFIPDSRIHLRIPPRALMRGQQIQLTAVMEPGQDGCPRPADCPRITPLVRCQPDGTTFQIPVELVLPHCGIIVEPEKVSVDVYCRHHVEKTGD